MYKFYADLRRCKEDGICAAICPTKVIKGRVGQVPAIRENREGSCIGCGHCVAFCPHGAAFLEGYAEKARAIDYTLLPKPEAIEMLCLSRRSIRSYKQEKIPADLWKSLLGLVRYAPSAKNEQELRWIVISEAENLQKIGDLMADYFSGLTQGPDISEATELAKAWRNDRDPFFRKAPHLLLAVGPLNWRFAPEDAAIALTYFEIAALTHGIGCCWAGYLTRATEQYEPLRKALGLSEAERLCGAQMAGYIKLKPYAVPERKEARIQWF